MIELNVSSGDDKLFTLTGSGFKPNEKVTLKSRSCNESTTLPLKVNAEGHFCIGYAPSVVGKTEGPFELIFSGENMMPMKIQHYWGHLAFYKPNAYRKLKNKYKFSD